MRSLSRGRLNSDEGLTLVELMVAIFVLAVAVVAIASVASSSLATVRLSRDRQHATNAASAAIEDARSRDFDGIVLSSTAAGLPSPACHESEPLVTQAGATNPVPLTTTAGPSGKITVTTYVTWFDDPDNGTADGCGHSDRKGKRLTAVASWEERGRTRTVTESTVVAEAGRGLPVPDFDIGVDAFKNFSAIEISNETEKCVDHVLRNFGAEDSYDWHIEAADGGSALQNGLFNGNTTFRTTGNSWAMRMFFEHPVQPSPPNVLASPVPNGVRLMSDVDADLHPEVAITNASDRDVARVQNDDTARLWVCYTPTKSQAPTHVYTDRTFRITVRSSFDERVSRSVEHDITIGTVGTPLRLTDRDDPVSHRRATYRSNGSFDAVPRFQMGPVSTLQPFQPHPSPLLGPCGEFLPNWDTDVDGTSRTVVCSDGSTVPVVGYPGTSMPPNGGTVALAGTTGVNVDMLWHQQFTADATTLDRAQLVFWSSYATALDVHQRVSGVGLPATAPTIAYRVQLEVLRNNEQPHSPPRIIWDSTPSYAHTDAGWMRQAVDMSFSSPLPTIGKNEYLRLRLQCLSTSEACHVAYDSVAYPSTLGVEIR